MSRRSRSITKKSILPDPVYSDPAIEYFINKMMWDGKKELARGIVYGALKELEKKQGQDKALEVFKKAIENCKPSLEVRSRRVGGATYQVPVDVRPVRKTALAVRWLIAYSRSRKEKTMAHRLAGEIMDAGSNKGSAIKKKEDVHKMAESNRAFSHYNW